MKSGAERVGMKGQLVFEFVVATLLFLAIVMYTINIINTTALQYSDGNSLEMIDNRAWEISEMLVRSDGIWGTTPPRAIGIAEQWPILSEEKITSLSGNCTTNFDDVLRLMNIHPDSARGMSIEVWRFSDPGESMIMKCGNTPGNFNSAAITRFGVSDTDGSLLKVKVFYW